MRTRFITACAALLLAAACQREPDAAPATNPEPQEQVPAAAAGDELRGADSIGPAAPTVDRPSAPQAAIGARGGATPAAGVPANAPAVSAAPSPSAQPAAAQDDGAAILQRAAAAYGNVRALRADFVMQLNNPLLRQVSTSRGTLYQRRPDRIALRFSDPAGDVILSDGEYYWVYYPSIDPKQVIRCAAASSGEHGVDLQAQFIGDPVQRFRYTVHGQESVGGRPAHVMTLEPKQRADYRTLKVWLDARDALARRFEITEANGTVRRFELSNFEVNGTIPDATFRFSPPADARPPVPCG